MFHGNSPEKMAAIFVKKAGTWVNYTEIVEKINYLFRVKDSEFSFFQKKNVKM